MSAAVSAPRTRGCSPTMPPRPLAPMSAQHRRGTRSPSMARILPPHEEMGLPMSLSHS